MKALDECVVNAMDGSDKELFHFLPFILQDLWDFGAEPDTIIRLVSHHFKKYGDLNVLDLGCCKGAVSVRLSHKLGCTCHGIDAIPEFIAFAQQKALEYKVNHLCTFETGDIREKVKDLTGYDIVILGAIGPVFGDYYTTLSTLSHCITDNGIFIIDDAYIDDESEYSSPLIFMKSAVMNQIKGAGMELIINEISNKGDIKDSNDFIFDKIKKRCFELTQKYPDKQNLFLDYIKKQDIENDVLQNKVIGGTMVIRKTPAG